MRNIVALTLAALTAVFAAPVVAADIPEYPDIEIPEVDYDLGDSFYLRGSAAINLHWAKEVRHGAAWTGQIVHQIDQIGYGYSYGIGFGYETGSGLRFDATIDQLETTGIRITKAAAIPAPDVAGAYTLMLRSTLGMVNGYYDFKFGDLGFGDGGAFGYVGAGVGLAWNHAEVNMSPAVLGGATFNVPTGTNISPAAALMAGVGYDMGSWVADLGYRGIWIAQVNNAPTNQVTFPGAYYSIDNNFIHELRGTVRYRFN
jgi:opacity protein-like surface antigen